MSKAFYLLLPDPEVLFLVTADQLLRTVFTCSSNMADSRRVME